jgi:predicted enzyme related to lactoylglutathione lyase
MPNPVVHFEIGGRDSAATQKFFTDLFGWTISPMGDLETYIAKAVELGGKKLVGPVRIPTGAFAWIADIDGNIIGLWSN